MLSRLAKPCARPLPLLLAALALSGAGLSSCSTSAKPHPGLSRVVDSYLTAWGNGAWPAMRNLTGAGRSEVVGANRGAFEELGVKRAIITHGSPVLSGSGGTRASVPVTWTVRLGDLGTLGVRTLLRLRFQKGRWRVVFSPETIDPRLRKGSRYVVTPTWAPRAAILASDGTVLSSEQATRIEVGVQGSFVKRPASLEATLVSAGAPATAAAEAIAAAKRSPYSFEPVFAVSPARYAELRPELYPVPGTVFRTLVSGTAPPPELSAVIGGLEPATAAQVAALGPPYSSASIVGSGGIAEAEQERLAGAPGGTVTIESTSGHVVATLLRKPPVAGAPVRTSIDPAVEKIAWQALSGEQHQAALVAVRASTGQVIAAVDTPSLGTEDLALDGALPPGSTFKVVTSTALILRGLTPASPATCPPTITVDGEIFHNASPADAASDMLQAFTVSCNTAYIGLATANLGYGSLHQAASLYGIGRLAPLGAAAFPGSVPVEVSPTDLAASAIGQGRIVVNPLVLASVAAAVDTGTVRSPRLVEGAAADSAPTHRLPAAVVDDLHQMMASVVASGTAAGTGLPPGTYAKTGTAEYGTVPPLPVDGWLMGFNGGIAFAMVTIDSPGDGGPVDGPIVAAFLDSVIRHGLAGAG